MDIAITKMSSKGQVVIPAEMRKGIKAGEKLLLLKNGEQYVLKKASKLASNFEKDLQFAKETEAAYLRHEKGKSEEMELDDFLLEAKKW